ncbi:hypothetical protein Lepto7376_0881 [[Leptolyngbya] sp. PCC 7376]|nr:hypothetical protein Lepto7376_0881 [[Leptolyngbya] sp. PCC 7376]
MGEHALGFSHLAQRAIDRLNGIGGVNDAADGSWIIKYSRQGVG